MFATLAKPQHGWLRPSILCAFLLSLGAGPLLGQTSPVLRICEIQGASHTSPHKDEQVSTRGIVTAVARNGFYFQDPIGDGDEHTSDGIFVYTKKRPESLRHR